MRRLQEDVDAVAQAQRLGVDKVEGLAVEPRLRGDGGQCPGHVVDRHQVERVALVSHQRPPGGDRVPQALQELEGVVGAVGAIGLAIL